VRVLIEMRHGPRLSLLRNTSRRNFGASCHTAVRHRGLYSSLPLLTSGRPILSLETCLSGPASFVGYKKGAQAPISPENHIVESVCTDQTTSEDSFWNKAHPLLETWVMDIEMSVGAIPDVIGCERQERDFYGRRPEDEMLAATRTLVFSPKQ
jgi:hypothetical protein